MSAVTTDAPLSTLDSVVQPIELSLVEGRAVERRGSVLPHVTRSEWTKLRSVPSSLWTLFATFVVTVGFGALFCWAYVNEYDKLTIIEHLTFNPTARSLGGLFLSQLSIGVVGVLVVSSEYDGGRIRTTLIAVPQRRTVLLAKAIVFGAVALLVSMVSVFVAFIVGQAILHGRHQGVSLGDPHVVRSLLGAAAYLTIIGLLGLGIAMILRRTAGAIATLASLVLVLPLLAAMLPGPWSQDIAKYLPSELGQSLFSDNLEPNLLSAGNALAVAGVWIIVVYAIAMILITRRDA